MESSTVVVADEKQWQTSLCCGYDKSGRQQWWQQILVTADEGG
jgi:hypothetical protein